MMLVNVALTMITLEWCQKRRWYLPALIGLLFALFVVGWEHSQYPMLSQAVFRINETLTRRFAELQPAFVV